MNRSEVRARTRIEQQTYMAKYQPALKLAELVAIDMHTHANVSQRQPPDPCTMCMDEAHGEVLQVDACRRRFPKSRSTTASARWRR